jgi:hypothetical protein
MRAMRIEVNPWEKKLGEKETSPAATLNEFFEKVMPLKVILNRLRLLILTWPLNL